MAKTRLRALPRHRAPRVLLYAKALYRIFDMTSTLWGRYLRLSALALVVILLLLTLPAALYHKDRSWHFSPELDARPRKLFQLLPINSDGSGPLFCKVLMSSLVHGYSPIILNWEAQGDGSYMQRMKVTGGLILQKRRLNKIS
jgi:hypothetical protein